MSDRLHTASRIRRRGIQGPVTLKMVARHVGLTPGTISATLNNSPAANAIPQRTKERIFAAVRKLDYRPNFFARSLRKRQSHTVGIIVREIGDFREAIVVSGIEKALWEKDYLFMIGVHRNDPELLKKYSTALAQHGVDGFITVNLALTKVGALPAVNIEVPENSSANMPIGPCDLSAICEALESAGQNAARALLEKLESRGESVTN